MRRTLLVPVLAAGLIVSFPVVHAQNKPAGVKDRFIGTWKLVTTETRNAKGEVAPNATRSNALGYLVYDPSGNMAVTIMPVGRKKYAAAQPTDEEARAALAGYTAYFGKFIINEAEGSVIHRLEGSVNPGMGVDQKRMFQLSGNRLTLKPPASANGNQSALIWERMPDIVNPTAEQRKFFGFWKLIGTERKNAKGEATATNPGQFGYIIYTPAGFMTVHMVQPSRKPYAAAQPTAAEARQNLRTYTNYFGPFYVHDADGYVVHDQFGSLSAGRNSPSPQQRYYRFVGNRLLLQPPPTYQDNDTIQSTITWEKVDADRATR